MVIILACRAGVPCSIHGRGVPIDNFMNKVVENKDFLKILIEKMAEMKINK